MQKMNFYVHSTAKVLKTDKHILHHAFVTRAFLVFEDARLFKDFHIFFSNSLDFYALFFNSLTVVSHSSLIKSFKKTKKYPLVLFQHSCIINF